MWPPCGLRLPLVPKPLDTTVSCSFWEAGVRVGGYRAKNDFSDHSIVSTKEVRSILLPTWHVKETRAFRGKEIKDKILTSQWALVSFVCLLGVTYVSFGKLVTMKNHNSVWHTWPITATVTLYYHPSVCGGVWNDHTCPLVLRDLAAFIPAPDSASAHQFPILALCRAGDEEGEATGERGSLRGWRPSAAVGLNSPRWPTRLSQRGKSPPGRAAEAWSDNRWPSVTGRATRVTGKRTGWASLLWIFPEPPVPSLVSAKQ